MQPVIDKEYLLKKASKHLLVVQYAFGTAGSLVTRIIGSSDKYYWDHVINNSYSDNIDPLYWPENGFIPQEHRLSAENQQRTCHTGYCTLFDDDDEDRDIPINIKLLQKAIKNNQKLIFKAHEDVHEYSNEVRVVRVVGYSVPIRKIRTRPTLTVLNHYNTYNLDMSKLFSLDYDIFFKEYLALCNFVDIVPNTEKVRTFINIWLDKQK